MRSWIVFPPKIPSPGPGDGPPQRAAGATKNPRSAGMARPRNDYIEVSVPGENGYDTFSPIPRTASPWKLQMTRRRRGLRAALCPWAKRARCPWPAPPIEVTPVAGLGQFAPDDAATIGTEARIAWTRPDYRSDYIAISEPGEKRLSGFAYGLCNNHK